MISLLSGLETKIIRGGGRDGISEDFEVQEVQFVIKILMYLHRLFGNVELDDKFRVYNSFSMTHVNNKIPTVKLKIPVKAFLKSESRISVTFKL